MIEPVLFFAVISKGKDDGLRVANALSQLMREDKTPRTKVDPDSGKLLVLGIGELHLDAIRRRLRRDFGVLSEFGPYEVFCAFFGPNPPPSRTITRQPVGALPASVSDHCPPPFRG